ncbi:MAG: cytochrome c [Burkholderiales bacterium]|nr:cytochrome c [Burkholderiales bacterium]
MRAVLVIALAAFSAFAPQAAAQDENRRRLAGELTVMAGDLRRLEAAAESPLRLEGLRARLAGALASLPLLLRQAASDATAVPAMRDAFARHDWQSLGTRLRELRDKHPFDAGSLVPGRPTSAWLRAGEALHRQTCAGCHDAPAVDTQLPALNLFEQARQMPREEFAARLLLGVRGDRSTAYRNPFSDLELAALQAYYEQGRADAVPAPQR